jgi:hypothetical protein
MPTIILPLVLYFIEAWPLILWEECKLEVFGDGVLRRMFERKTEK